MRKRSAKPASRKSAHSDYELPDEINFEKTRFIGFGFDALERSIAQPKTVKLAKDVADEFASAEEVNEALRLVKQIRKIGVGRMKQRRKAS